MSTDTFRYDSADYLATEEAISGYAEDVLDARDPELMDRAVGVVIRAYGLRVLAETSGLSRDAIVDALSGEDPNGPETLKSALVATSLRSRRQAAE